MRLLIKSLYFNDLKKLIIELFGEIDNSFDNLLFHFFIFGNGHILKHKIKLLIIRLDTSKAIIIEKDAYKFQEDPQSPCPKYHTLPFLNPLIKYFQHNLNKIRFQLKILNIDCFY